jgi:hypothetical protein
VTLGRENFEARYAANPDPWGFETSAYEHEKYERTLAALGHRHYGRAFEAGCSIGVFTAMLAERCDELLAVDIAQAAVDSARQAPGRVAPRPRRAPHTAGRLAVRPLRPRRLLRGPLLLGPRDARRGARPHRRVDGPRRAPGRRPLPPALEQSIR